MFGIIAALLQLPFLISAILIGPDRVIGGISERAELFLIKVSSWSRWIYIPATAAFLYTLFRDDSTGPWLAWAFSALDVYLLLQYWNAGRDALDEYEDDEELDIEKFRIDDKKENRDV